MTGRLEVLTGPMFAGKTDELIRRLRFGTWQRKRVICFKPTVDTRYSLTSVVSHNKGEFPCSRVTSVEGILAGYEGEELVGVDEAQFFPAELVEICDRLVSRGAHVIVAGLDLDYQGRPFGAMPGLMASAEVVTKLPAACACCPDLGTRTFRVGKEGGLVLLGAQGVYEARCRACWVRGREEQ